MEVPEGVEPANGDEDTAEMPLASLSQIVAAVRAELTAEKGVEPPSLSERIAAVRSACDHIKKESAGVGTGHSVEEVLRQVRPLLAAHRILITPSLISVAYEGNRCNVIVDFQWECTDTGETRVIRWGGSDTDKMGKALSKAGTNAMKEHFKKFLLITDREDAKEETDSVEFQSNEGATRAEVDKITEQKRAAIEQWAKALKMALIKADNIKDIQRLERENKDQLIDPTLQDVTRDFFVELIAQRKSDLTEK